MTPTRGALTSVVTFLALLAGPGCVVFGLRQVGGIGTLLSAWSPGALTAFITFVTVVTLIAGIVFLLPAQSRRVYGALLTLGALVWAFEASAVLSVFLIVLGAMAWGTYLAFDSTIKTTAEDYPAKRWLIAAAVGFAFLVCAANSLSHFAINGRVLYLAILLMPIALQRRLLARAFQSLTDWLLNPRPETARREGSLLLALVLAVHAAHGALPELGSDALAMHLFVPTTVSTLGRWTYDVMHYAWAVMPLGADWLFSYAFIIGGETSAKLLNLVFGAGTAWLLYLHLRQFLSPAWASLFVAACTSAPILVMQSTTLFVENTLMFFMLVGFVLVERLDHSWRSWLSLWLVIAALCNIKLHGAVFGVGLALVALWRGALNQEANQLLRRLGLSVLVVPLALQPYLTSFWLTGNPLFPFFNAVFRSEQFPSIANFADQRWARGWSLDSVWGMTFQSSRFLESGSPGAPGYLALAVGLLLFWAIVVRPSVAQWRALALCLWFLSIVGASVQYIRYFSPVLPILTVASISIVNVGGSLIRGGIGVMLLGVVTLNLLSLPSGGPFLNGFYPAQLLVHGRGWILSMLVPQRMLTERIMQREEGPTTVAYFGMPAAAGLQGIAIFDGWYNTDFMVALQRAKTEDEVATIIGATGAKYVVTSATDVYGQRALVLSTLKAHAKLIESVGWAQLFLLNDQFRLGRELLGNGGFDRDLTSWSTPAGSVRWVPGGFATLQPGASVSQVVQTDGRVRRLEVTATINCSPTEALVMMALEWSNVQGLATNQLGSDYGTCGGVPDLTLHFNTTAPDSSGVLRVVVSTFNGSDVAVDKVSLRPTLH